MFRLSQSTQLFIKYLSYFGSNKVENKKRFNIFQLPSKYQSKVAVKFIPALTSIVFCLTNEQTNYM